MVQPGPAGHRPPWPLGLPQLYATAMEASLSQSLGTSAVPRTQLRLHAGSSDAVTSGPVWSFCYCGCIVAEIISNGAASLKTEIKDKLNRITRSAT